jgi:hypothetical protein
LSASSDDNHFVIFPVATARAIPVIPSTCLLKKKKNVLLFALLERGFQSLSLMLVVVFNI